MSTFFQLPRPLRYASGGCAEIFEVGVVCLTEFAETDLHFRVVYENGAVRMHAGQCPLSVTPCAAVKSAKSVQSFDRVQEKYPAATFLRDHEIQFYCGVPVFEPSGDVMGVVCIMDEKARTFSDEELYVLRLISQRISLELERLSVEQLRRQAEEQQDISDRRLRLVLDHIPDGFFVIDRNWRYLEINRSGAAMLDGNPAQLIGRSYYDEFPKARGTDLERMYRQAMETRAAAVVEEYCTRRNRWFEARVYPCTEGIAVLVSDITERRQLEAQLRWKEIIVQNMFAGTAIVSMGNGTILSASRRFEQMFGYGDGELLGQPVIILNAGDFEFSAEKSREVMESICKTGSWQGELLNRRKDGSTFWTRSSVVAFEHPEYGAVAIGVQQDITESKHAEQRVLALQDALAHANRFESLGEIASGLAHELNQPLTAITTNAEAARTLTKGLDSPILDNILEQIAGQSLRAGEIIQRMRSFIRRESPGRKTNDINRLVGEVLGLLGDQLRLNAVLVKTQFSDNLPAVMVDAIQIQQVLVNLIRNAADAVMQNDRQARCVSIRTQTIENGIRVSVSDNGCGLDPKIADRLFFPFQTTKSSGLGLGLSISRTLIEYHGGKITAHSNPERGTTFTFTLPAGE